MWRSNKIFRMLGNLENMRAAKTLEEFASVGSEKMGASAVSTWTNTLHLKGWELGEDTKRQFISKKYQFGDFKQAFHFMKLNAAVADKLDHHPEWFNVYNRVEVTLSTHTANGVTWKDMVLAYSMDHFVDIAEKSSGSEYQKLFGLEPRDQEGVEAIVKEFQRLLSGL